MIADDELRARVVAIVGHATGAVASGQPPLAAFVTVGVLKRVKKYISEMDSAQRSGWGEQAALARAVAELTGSPLGVPPNDGSAETIGNALGKEITQTHAKLWAKASARKSSQRAAARQAELERLVICAFGYTPSRTAADRAIARAIATSPSTSASASGRRVLGLARQEVPQGPLRQARARRCCRGRGFHSCECGP